MIEGNLFRKFLTGKVVRFFISLVFPVLIIIALYFVYRETFAPTVMRITSFGQGVGVSLLFILVGFFIAPFFFLSHLIQKAIIA